jgi:colanic acid/amylovoran biosynthesis protein
LENKTARKIIKDTLSRCTFVSVREKLSKKCLDDISVHSFLFPDLGFFLKPSVTCFDAYLSNKNVPLDQKKVAITLRPYRFQGSKNPEELYNNYLTGIIKLVEYLVIHGYHVTFMAHTLGPSSHENDSLAIKEVRQNLNSDILSKTSIIEDFELNCRDVEKIYSYYDFLIGTRFHSVIFALNVNTPSIAIAYGGNKGKGIMNVLGNDEYSIDIDKISPSSLLEMFNELESQKDDYITRLQQSRINIDSERMKLVEEIKLCLS